MHFVAALALLPAALAANAAEDAGAPQSPPTYTDTSGLSTIDTSTWTSYPTGPASYPSGPTTPSAGPYPGSPMMTTVPHPIINGTIGTGGGYPTLPGDSSTMPGNLSTTARQPTTSVTVATVTGAGGSASTQTSTQVVAGSGGAPAGSSPAATGTTQSGEAGKLQGGAAAALAILGGFLVLML